MKLELVLKKELLQSGCELAPEDATPSGDGQEEWSRGGDPLGTVGCKTASRNQVVYVGMMVKVLSPSVEHAKKPDVGPQMFRVAGEFEQRRCTPLMDCRILRIEKATMLKVLHREHAFSDLFVAYLVSRNNHIQEDLVDQLFNSAEKRLTRILLLLAHFGKEGRSETVIPKMSQETLAEMVGTTRARVNFFMNRFRQMGLIDYNGGWKFTVHCEMSCALV